MKRFSRWGWAIELALSWATIFAIRMLPVDNIPRGIQYAVLISLIAYSVWQGRTAWQAFRRMVKALRTPQDDSNPSDAKIILSLPMVVAILFGIGGIIYLLIIVVTRGRI